MEITRKRNISMSIFGRIKIIARTVICWHAFLIACVVCNVARDMKRQLNHLSGHYLRSGLFCILISHITWLIEVFRSARALQLDNVQGILASLLQSSLLSNLLSYWSNVARLGDVIIYLFLAVRWSCLHLCPAARHNTVTRTAPDMWMMIRRGLLTCLISSPFPTSLQ